MPQVPEQPAPKWSLAVWLATGLGVGLAMPAPGTFGALWGLPLAWAYDQLPGPVWHWGAAGVVLLLGVPVCGRAAADLGRKDPGPVVWDEFATVPLVFLLVPIQWPWIALIGLWVAPAIRYYQALAVPALERLPAGWGIVADDVIAAFYAAVVLWGVSFAWR